MANKKMLLFLIASYFCCTQPLLPPGRNSPSASVGLQENVEASKSLEESRLSKGSENGISYQNNFGSGAGGKNEPRGQRDNSGDGSKTPNGAAGTAIIPLYAAGAAGSHHNNHHGASSCGQSCVDLQVVCAVMLVSLVHIM
ncbi:hypothetical protein NMG60_11008844 [Bertholletia excelsa]